MRRKVKTSKVHPKHKKRLIRNKSKIMALKKQPKLDPKVIKQIRRSEKKVVKATAAIKVTETP